MSSPLVALLKNSWQDYPYHSHVSKIISSPFVSLDFQAMFEQYVRLLVKVYFGIFQSMFDGLTLTAKELSSPTTRVIQIDTRGDLA